MVIIGLLLLVVMAVAVHRGRRRTSAAQRRAVVDRAVIPTIDLIVVTVGSGGTVRAAVTAVATHGPPAVADVFATMLAETRRGRLLVDVMAVAGDELGPGFRPVIGALIATERDGAPVGLLLQRLADDADQARRTSAEALARRLQVALLPPLVLCQLPAVVVGAMVPLGVLAFRQLTL